MRARLALMHCGAQCELREVVLKEKPSHMLDVSRKGTVPVLLLPNENMLSTNSSTTSSTAEYTVIDESIDIMRWAMNQNPNRNLSNASRWQVSETLTIDEINALITNNDLSFKKQLDKYKYSDRHPENTQAYYLAQALPFLENLNSILSNSQFLSGEFFRFVDAAILPFIRQFAMVNLKTFHDLPLPHLQQWLTTGMNSELFSSVMPKFPQWKAESQQDIIVFGNQ